MPLLPKINNDGINSLTAPVSKDEVRRAVSSMKSYKAPGPDGFRYFLCKHFWDTVGTDVWNVAVQAFGL